MILTTFFLYFIFLIMVHNLSMFNSEGTMQIAFSSGKSWLIIILVAGISKTLQFGFPSNCKEATSIFPEGSEV